MELWHLLVHNRRPGAVLQLLAQPLLTVHIQDVIVEGVRAVGQGTHTKEGHHTDVASILVSENGRKAGPDIVCQLNQHPIVPRAETHLYRHCSTWICLPGSRSPLNRGPGKFDCMHPLNTVASEKQVGYLNSIHHILIGIHMQRCCRKYVSTLCTAWDRALTCGGDNRMPQVTQLTSPACNSD